MTVTITTPVAPWHNPPATVLGEIDIVGDLVVYAVSTDLEWTYERISTEGTWRVTHELTGLELLFSGLPVARQWTATGDGAVTDLRITADALTTTPFVIGEEQARGRRALMLLASPPTLLPIGTDVDAVCRCGGYLTAADVSGRRLHIDTCAEELHAPDDRCPDDRNSHHVCDQPTAVLCGHCGQQPNDLNATACLGAGRSRRSSGTATGDATTYCCGCCHQDGQV